MADNYDELDELFDWEEMDKELETSTRGSKPTGCCLLPCISMISVIFCIMLAVFML